MKKFVLGILGLVLILSVVLGSFVNLDASDPDYSDQSLGVLEPTEPELELTETVNPDPNYVEPEPESEVEQTSPEPDVVVESHKPESEVESTPEPSNNPEPAPEPEPTQTDTTPLVHPVQNNYSAPVLNAINYFRASTEPEAMLWLDVMHRRFEIEEFAGASNEFEKLMIWFPTKSYVNLFRRMVDYDFSVNSVELKRVTNELDLITLPALYCDQLTLPANYSILLVDGAREGGYKLTHVLLAWIWLQENGGAVELSEGFVEDMYLANAALINTDDDVTDLELEAAAFLCLAGKTDLVDESFIDKVIEAQASDGSWGGTIKRWHTTVLGLMYLLHLEFPSDTYPSVLAPA